MVSLKAYMGGEAKEGCYRELHALWAVSAISKVLVTNWPPIELVGGYTGKAGCTAANYLWLHGYKVASGRGQH